MDGKVEMDTVTFSALKALVVFSDGLWMCACAVGYAVRHNGDVANGKMRRSDDIRVEFDVECYWLDAFDSSV